MLIGVQFLGLSNKFRLLLFTYCRYKTKAVFLLGLIHQDKIHMLPKVMIYCITVSSWMTHTLHDYPTTCQQQINNEDLLHKCANYSLMVCSILSKWRLNTKALFILGLQRVLKCEAEGNHCVALTDHYMTFHSFKPLNKLPDTS